jgi:putative flippase GtrA
LLLIRFGLVGAAATVTYFAATVAFVEWIALPPTVASVIGMALGFAVSYFGQHSFTFRAQTAHHYYFPRFLLAQAAIFLLSSAAMWAGTRWLKFDYRLVAGFISLAWPIFSFLAANFWVFADRTG